MHIYVYTMQGNSGKGSLARATFKNKATGVWARSIKALKCELWATVSVTAQDIIPPTRCFSQLMLCLLLKDTVPSTEVTKKKKIYAKVLSSMQSSVIYIQGLMEVSLNWNLRVKSWSKTTLLYTDSQRLIPASTGTNSCMQ